jgi:APA family basic amino acid/polyamine antiporter
MTGLQRRLNRIDALAIAIGAVIGVAVFRNTGVALRGAHGVVGATWLWLAVGAVSLAGAVMYADLSARVPEAGGPYAYVRVAFGRPAGFVYGWMNAGIAMPVRQATNAAAIGGLLAEWLPGGERVLGASVIVVLAAVTLLGVKAGALAQRALTAIRLIALAVAIALGAWLAVTRTAPATPLAAMTATPFIVAVAAVWKTYLGWQDVVFLAEELREPRRDLPLVLVGTVALVTVLYTALHLALYFGSGGGAEAYSDLPARDIAGQVLGAAGFAVLTGLTLCSYIGGSAENILVRPRIAMALGRDGLGWRWLGAIARNGTPYGAITFYALAAIAFMATGTYTELLPLLAFSQGFLGVFEVASYFVIRRKRPDLPTSRLHPWAPLTFLAANIALCWLAAVQDVVRTCWALALLAVLALAYAVVRRLVPRRPDLDAADRPR